MKYDPRLRTWVEDDFDYEANFKKQMDYINYKDLEKQLNENVDYHALLDQDEAIIFLKTLGSNLESLRDDIYSITDPLSNFSGNIKDAPGVFKVAKHFKPINVGITTHIINELKGKGVKAIEYLGKNGIRYIKLTDSPDVRRYLNSTRYLINDKKIMEVGVGSVAMESSIVSGARFGIVFSAGYRAVELMIKDEYSLTDFFVNLSVDIAKLVVATAIAKVTVSVATSAMFTTALSATAIAFSVFLVGVSVAYGLYYLDSKYKISETIIKNLKEYKIKPPTPYHPDQFFNVWGRYSRG
ncbi:hypothetical protein [Xenorhabdus griffiniae]|uniref:Uncharacterized protein n=1 Tax=Xenorhabdus griffiniae TaxID=351672 RepID=A0ABY9XHY9_9GAMM|nr:hypothetical protein [Xenorhabdus griffiniae]MBD1229031.1 hypothetical protein [Xenorhabdus griffiniae]MBE8588698.1 hypothetical protein [Xenorhabdus griffiniae]WMV72560.1 hypothetical protein QL128_00340 [Xenorhabdus griffiniae]WNH02238.1 hypothetical protein QL112_000340 [Xenorhabdus griffiniae]